MGVLLELLPVESRRDQDGAIGVHSISPPSNPWPQKHCSFNCTSSSSRDAPQEVDARRSQDGTGQSGKEAGTSYFTKQLTSADVWTAPASRRLQARYDDASVLPEFGDTLFQCDNHGW